MFGGEVVEVLDGVNGVLGDASDDVAGLDVLGVGGRAGGDMIDQDAGGSGGEVHFLSSPFCEGHDGHSPFFGDEGGLSDFLNVSLEVGEGSLGESDVQDDWVGDVMSFEVDFNDLAWEVIFDGADEVFREANELVIDVGDDVVGSDPMFLSG